MRFGKRHSSAVRVVAAFAAAVTGFAAVVRGAELCLCDPDPDGCGQPCHVCGAADPEGISQDEGCHHLELDAADLAIAETSVVWPVLPESASVIPAAVALPVLRKVPVPHAAGPPGPRLYLSHRFCVLCSRS